jgi:hypothetical protein
MGRHRKCTGPTPVDANRAPVVHRPRTHRPRSGRSTAPCRYEAHRRTPRHPSPVLHRNPARHRGSAPACRLATTTSTRGRPRLRTAGRTVAPGAPRHRPARHPGPTCPRGDLGHDHVRRSARRPRCRRCDHWGSPNYLRAGGPCTRGRRAGPAGHCHRAPVSRGLSLLSQNLLALGPSPGQAIRQSADLASPTPGPPAPPGRQPGSSDPRRRAFDRCRRDNARGPGSDSASKRRANRSRCSSRDSSPDAGGRAHDPTALGRTG